MMPRTPHRPRRWALALTLTLCASSAVASSDPAPPVDMHARRALDPKRSRRDLAIFLVLTVALPTLFLLAAGSFLWLHYRHPSRRRALAWRRGARDLPTNDTGVAQNTPTSPGTTVQTSVECREKPEGIPGCLPESKRKGSPHSVSSTNTDCRSSGTHISTLPQYVEGSPRQTPPPHSPSLEVLRDEDIEIGPPEGDVDDQTLDSSSSSFEAIDEPYVFSYELDPTSMPYRLHRSLSPVLEENESRRSSTATLRTSASGRPSSASTPPGPPRTPAQQFRDETLANRSSRSSPVSPPLSSRLSPPLSHPPSSAVPVSPSPPLPIIPASHLPDPAFGSATPPLSPPPLSATPPPSSTFVLPSAHAHTDSNAC